MRNNIPVIVRYEIGKAYHAERMMGKGARERVAEHYGISGRTVQDNGYFVETLDYLDRIEPGFLNQVLSGHIKLDGYVQALITYPRKTATEQTEIRCALFARMAKEPQGGGEYSIDNLLHELEVNGKAYVEQVRRTLEIRKDAIKNPGDAARVAVAMGEIVTGIQNLWRKL